MDVNLILLAAIFVFSSVVSIFLFYRAGKHDLIDEDILFDTIVAGLIGALLGGRIIDFIIRADFYSWSITKLIFFNVHGGFDLYGAALGAILLAVIYLNKKRQKSWLILDYSVAGIVLAFSLFSLGRTVIFRELIWAVYFVIFTVLFWIIKRLEKEKKFGGFFVSIAIITISVVNIVVSIFGRERQEIFTVFDYNLLMPSIMFAIGVVLFYILSKNNLVSNIKSIGITTFLSILKTKRLVTNVSEANQLARSIIFFPLTLAIIILDLVKLLGRQLYLSFKELLVVFGIKNDRY